MHVNLSLVAIGVPRFRIPGLASSQSLEYGITKLVKIVLFSCVK